MLSSKALYNKYIGQKKEKQYIAVGTVRMFIETSTSLTHSPYTTKIARMRRYMMLSTIFFSCKLLLSCCLKDYTIFLSGGS